MFGPGEGPAGSGPDLAYHWRIATVASRTAVFATMQAHQLHGGMGMSAELSVSHYFKRLTLINASWGDVDHHVGIVGNLLLAEEPA